MRLKKIRLAGFKSFVDPTNIPFPGDMTAIVGPNGCGKSNVIDAVRWVLGESSAKNLRGDSMTDVIFNGSSARKPVSQCSVELVFDNTDNRIQGEYAAFNEISVKRLVTKDAVSTYFLNASKCRRKDITDLFLGTGLGPRSYAIIEQGMISKLIESKPQELRVFIEEAAGISKYKERRRETQTRISHTKENLDRLEDVRQELGDQIAKLSRQAAAANRYKDLKQQERQLKAELACIKWLAQSNLIAETQSLIDNKQLALDSIKASQEGDESGLQSLKNQQTFAKQEIDDLQQQIFTLGTEITKMEQSQLFAKKRATQIQAEIDQIKQSESSLLSAIAGLAKEIDISQQKMIEAEPEKALIEEQLHEIEDKKYSLDDALDKQLIHSKAKEDEYHKKTQALQQKHSQIQQTLSLQERSETSLNELLEELSQLSDTNVSTEIKILENELKQSQQNLLELEQNVKEEQEKVHTANELSKSAKLKLEKLNEQKIQLSAELNALVALQTSSADSNHEVQNDNLMKLSKQAIWAYFQVESGAEIPLQSALKEMQQSLVIDADLQVQLNVESMLAWEKSILKGHFSAFFSQNFTTTKKPNTLACKLLNELVPEAFNAIYVVASFEQAVKRLPNLQPHEKIITLEGIILRADSITFGEANDNKFLRANQIEKLDLELNNIKSVYNEANINWQLADKSLAEHNSVLSTLQKKLLSDTQAHQSIDLRHKNLLFQAQQGQQRKNKIEQDISTHQERLNQEAMSLDILNEQVEDISIEVVQLEAQKDQALNSANELRQAQQQWQLKQNQLQTKLHEQMMLVQQVRNSFQILQEQKNSKTRILNDSQEKLEMLVEEAQDLLMPEQEQQEKLQQMLATQQLQREKLIEKQQLLAQIEDDISQIEKGQHGIQAKMDEINAVIQSHQIMIESAKVRAHSFIEQLSELKQSLKVILETLDTNADEKTWQANLDKVVSGIQRLGAVNLAAVDEYEEQSKRKAHLDTQNQDLSEALDTLEAAMRKIDKETRSRFKHTFDRVNGDLKNLFPKVFGGGMAYLDLTNDDLLDTGVTIMARPPGKKNSTIQLLSGGEKALTALSLVFAIFRLNPAPFCLLDEVDAPLDDANVGRFCRLVSQMSETVQFIYITHNKVAMEMATHLTGVTMAEPGVSRMVAVDMEQALAIAE